MSRPSMQRLLPLAVLCLLSAQLAAAARAGTGRMLLQKPMATAVNLSRQQFLQATWALEGVSCQDVATALDDQYVNNTLAKAVIADVQAALTLAGWPEAARTVVAVRQPCKDILFNGKKCASYRTMIRFNSTNSTDVKDLMFAGVGTGAARPCTGGFNRLLYPNVAALFSQFKVSHNNGNRQNSFFPNGPGPTGFGDNWVEYAGPDMSICKPPTPSPSPSLVASPSPSLIASPSPSPVASPSPSPVASPGPSPVASPGPSPVASPSPSPSPTPAVNCASIPGSVSNGTTCVCGNSSLPFGYYAAASAGTPAVLQQCTAAPAPDARCQTPPYTRPVAESDVNIMGCLLNSATTTVCPIGYGFGLPYLNTTTDPPSLVACRRSNQGNCPTSEFLTQAISTVNGATLDACLAIPTGGSCPTTYPVFAQSSLPYPSTGVPVAMCLTAGSSCPTSTIASQNFPFNLWSNGVVQGCLAPQLAFTSCTGFSPYNGAAVFTTAGAGGCQTPSTTTCPAGLVAFWDISLNVPQLLQCRPALAFGQTCLSTNRIGGTLYTTNLRTENGTIIGCLSAGSQCPSATNVLNYPTWVATSFAAPQTSPSDCLPATTQSCPSLGYSPAREFSLYRGISVGATRTTLALPKLFACVPRATTGNANSCASYGNAANTFSATVWGDAAATNLVGCAVRGGIAGGAVPPDQVGGGNAAVADIASCPSTAPFFMLGSGIIGNTLAPSRLVECRPADITICAFPAGGVGTDASRYIVEVRNIAGSLVGCKELTVTAAQTGCSVGSSTAANGQDGYPYDFNFPIVGNGGNGAPRLVQCRKTLSTWPSSCAAYTSLPGTTAHTIPLLQGTTITSPAAAAGTLGTLAGCMAAGTRCPSATDMNVFSCAYGQGTGATSAVCGAPAGTVAGTNGYNGFPIPLISIDGTSIEQCRWNGLGGGDITTINTTPVSTAPGTAPTTIAVQCTANSGYSIAVGAATYTAMVANIVASPPDAGMARTGTAETYGQNVRGCMAAGANAAACYQLTGTGFPFNDGVGSVRFIQSVENTGLTAGTLVGCAPLTSGTACSAARTFSVFTRSSPATTTTPVPNFMSGCATGTAGGASSPQVANTQTCVNNFYSLFTPRAQASST